jgi:hypothetical protein
MSVAADFPARVAPRTRAAVRTPVVDGLLFATVFAVTFAKVRWEIGSLDLTIADVIASCFVVGFLLGRIERHDRRLPASALTLIGFFAAFSVVYLVGFFNLETVADRNQFVKGMVKFVIHFLFLVFAVAHIGRRPPDFYWRVLGWFVAGVAANAVYGLLELAVAETSGGNLDQAVLSPIGSYQQGGINVFGTVEGQSVFRTNALTGDPNHLGIILGVPILILLPIYLRLGRGHRLRTPLALLLAFLGLVELSTLSRSGLLGLAVGLIVLSIPYWRLLLTARFLVPLGILVAVVAVVVAQRASFFERVLEARTSVGGRSTQVHLEVYELLPPLLDTHPLFGRGINTFANYYAFVTGKDNFGPHSYYIALLTETGIVGALLFACFLGYLGHRLRVLHRIGTALDALADSSDRSVHPLAWGLTAALAATLASNVFYLTMHMYYFFVFAMLVVAAPLVFARRRQTAQQAPSS